MVSPSFRIASRAYRGGRRCRPSSLRSQRPGRFPGVRTGPRSGSPRRPVPRPRLPASCFCTDRRLRGRTGSTPFRPRGHRDGTGRLPYSDTRPGVSGAFLFQCFGKFAVDQRDRRSEGKGRVPEAVFDGVVVCFSNDVFDLHVCFAPFLHDSKSDFRPLARAII